jgi:hypothetical protein
MSSLEDNLLWAYDKIGPLWACCIGGLIGLLLFRETRLWLLESLRRASDRLAIWAAALVVTFFGPMSTVAPHWPLSDWAAKANAAVGFKEIWLALLGMLVLSTSNIFDNLVRNRGRLSYLTNLVLPWLILLNLG